MSDEVKHDDESAQLSIGQKRQINENGGPVSKKANLSESGKIIIFNICFYFIFYRYCSN